MKFVLFVFCADFCFSFSISFCAKIIKISKSSLKCKKCVEVCVCVCRGRTHADQWQRGRERDGERGRTVVFTLRTTLLLQLSSFLHMSHALSTRLRVSLYICHAPLHSPSAVSGNSSLYFSTLTQ